MRRTFALCIAFAAALGSLALADEGPAPLTFERHVRPILKANCFHCHGEDGHLEGGLDLRLRRLLAEGGDSGAAIEPGNVDASLLIERLRAGEMPPGDSKLSVEQIDTIARWIADGAVTARPEPEAINEAPYFTQEERDHWAFQPIRRPPLPQVQDASRVRTPIDRFLLARLEEEKLRFSPDADRAALIRRASFDLLGLPPTPEQVDAFVSDDSPDAYERLIDGLLASPHYGERWGRHWLDVAGYADSEGYAEEDAVRESAFRYRDYVIGAFNSDKPFDQFVQEQLAGDEMTPPPYANLSPEAAERLTATGFLRMAPDGTASRGVDAPVARNQVIADTLHIVSTSLLGLTVACAQCHDHRYDPIPQVDYYRMRAIFEPALDWKNWKVPSAREISLATDADRQFAREVQAEAAKVDQERQQKAQEYIDRTLELELVLLPDDLQGSLRSAYKAPAKERSAEQQALLKEHPNIANISVGSLYLYDRKREERARKIEAHREALQRELLAAATAQQPTVTAETLCEIDPDGAARLAKLTEAAALVRATDAQADLKKYSDRAAEIRARIPKEQFIRALTETPGQAPPTFLFYRGDHDQPKQVTPPGELAILQTSAECEIPVDDPSLPTTGRRLAYARRLTDGQHPLVARVIANRIWLHHFGRGIVNSPGDFGALGEPPTHPELLDWLAAELVAGGWSMKRLHRLIMTSTAYRQSSRRSGDQEAVDPDNRLYARMSIRRIEAETLRDAALAVSGALNAKMHGPPVPVMEDEVGQIVIGQENLDGERKPGQAISLGGDEHRRSVYVQVRRSRPLAALETFDSPDMSPNCESRASSNVASQSLFLMNSGLMVEYAGRFADRLLSEAPGDPQAQVQRAWRLALGREPTREEAASSDQFLASQRAAAAEQDAKMAPAQAERRALATLCQALLSSNEFLYID